MKTKPGTGDRISAPCAHYAPWLGITGVLWRPPPDASRDRTGQDRYNTRWAVWYSSAPMDLYMAMYYALLAAGVDSDRSEKLTEHIPE